MPVVLGLCSLLLRVLSLNWIIVYILRHLLTEKTFKSVWQLIGLGKEFIIETAPSFWRLKLEASIKPDKCLLALGFSRWHGFILRMLKLIKQPHNLGHSHSQKVSETCNKGMINQKQDVAMKPEWNFYNLKWAAQTKLNEASSVVSWILRKKYTIHSLLLLRSILHCTPLHNHAGERGCHCILVWLHMPLHSASLGAKRSAMFVRMQRTSS